LTAVSEVVEVGDGRFTSTDKPVSLINSLPR